MKKICVATYNIFHGDYVKEDVGLIGRELSGLGADLVGLQEVDICTERVGGADTLRQIAEAGGYPYYAFSHAIDLRGGEYGTAVLSRYPILSFETVPLSSPDVEGRSVGHALIDVDGRRIDFFNTHLSVESQEVRLCQFGELKALIDKCQSVIVTGDFNTEDLEDLALLSPLVTVNEKRFGSYYPRNIAIDHIFYTEDFTPSDVQLPALPHSDHYPITACFSF